MTRFINVILSGVLLFGAIAFSSCKDNNDDPAAPTSYGRTVLVYMAMQNSIGSQGHHRNDSTEIANAISSIPENDRLLLFIDDASNPRIYELSKGLSAPKLLKQWSSDISSASAETLTEVLEYMRTNYTSNAYALVVGSHASGWLPTPTNYSAMSRKRTIGIDVGPDGSMRTDKAANGNIADQIEIDDFASAVLKSGVHLQYILFDACLMQSIEVDYALRNAADYIIASPISISVEGAYYTDLVSKGLFSSDVRDVARTYADYYKGKGSYPYPSESSLDFYGTVISCVRTASLDAFASTFSAFLQEHAASTPKNANGKIDWTMASALNYYPYTANFYFRPHNYDLLNAVEAMGASKAELNILRQALSEIVVCQEANNKFWIGPGYYDFQTMPESTDDWCGVSMFVPQQLYSDNAVNCAYGDLNTDFQHTQWYKAAGWSVTGW